MRVNFLVKEAFLNEKLNYFPVRVLYAEGKISEQEFFKAIKEEGIRIPEGYAFKRISYWWVKRAPDYTEDSPIFDEAHPSWPSAFQITLGRFDKKTATKTTAGLTEKISENIGLGA